MSQGIFHQRLYAKTGNQTFHQVVGDLYMACNFVFKTHLLEIHIEFDIFHLFIQCYKIPFFRECVHFQQLPQRYDHLIDFLVVAYLGFPGDGI